MKTVQVETKTLDKLIVAASAIGDFKLAAEVEKAIAAQDEPAKCMCPGCIADRGFEDERGEPADEKGRDVYTCGACDWAGFKPALVGDNLCCPVCLKEDDETEYVSAHTLDESSRILATPQREPKDQEAVAWYCEPRNGAQSIGTKPEAFVDRRDAEKYQDTHWMCVRPPQPLFLAPNDETVRLLKAIKPYLLDAGVPREKRIAIDQYLDQQKEREHG